MIIIEILYFINVFFFILDIFSSFRARTEQFHRINKFILKHRNLFSVCFSIILNNLGKISEILKHELYTFT